MKNKIRISAVNFLNTLPFRYGLEMSDKMKQLTEISWDIPSLCAKKLEKGEVEIGLVPIAVLPRFSNYHILTKYCIGAKQQVDSVFLFSEKPLNELEKIILDYRSLTSINLAKVLSSNYWKINPEWINAEINYEDNIADKTGGIVIGDKALQLIDKFPYKYDLAEEWYKYSGEEFVFAAWVSREKLPNSFLEAFNSSLEKGITQLDKAIELYGHEYPGLPVEHYLKNRIDYLWNNSKKRSLKRFLSEL